MNRVFVDVREPYEFASGHVDGAINIPAADLAHGAKQLNKLAKDTEIIVYCVSGGRASSAVLILNKLGFSNVKNGINKANIEANYS